MEGNRLRLVTAILTAGIVGSLVVSAVAQESKHICFLTVAKEFDSGHTERKNYVINSRVEWEDLWAKINRGTTPEPILPEIDFTRRTIIGVFQGVQFTSGYEVVITDVVMVDGRIRIVGKDIVNLHCSGTGGLTEPLHVVEVEKLDPVSVEFKMKQKVRKCQ